MLVVALNPTSQLAVAEQPAAGDRDDAQATKNPLAAPDFDLPVVQGGGIGKLAELRGKVVVVEFWATYCGWCKKTHPSLARFARKHKDDVAVLGISSQGSSRLRRWLRKNRVGFTVLHDNRRRVARAYRASGTPTLVVIDQLGDVRFYGVGLPAAKKALKVAAELLP